MDTLLRGLKQMSTGLKFTVDKELSSTGAYTSYKGRYKDSKATVFKYKKEHLAKALESLPLIKSVTDSALAKILTYQQSGGHLYIVTERVYPKEKEEGEKREFIEFVKRKIKACNGKIESENRIRVSSLGSEEVESAEIYFTEAGNPVAAGVVAKFVQEAPAAGGSEEFVDWGRGRGDVQGAKASEENTKADMIEKLDGMVSRYKELSKNEQDIVKDLIRRLFQALPQRYSQYCSTALMENVEKEDVDRKKESARTVLLLQTKTPGVAHLFGVKDPQVRVVALKHMQEKKKTVDAALMKMIFEEFVSGMVCTDEEARRESIEAVRCLAPVMDAKQKSKVLAALTALTKKGKEKEKEECAKLILEEHAEFLEVPEVLYSCMVCLVQSTEVCVKKNGLYLVEKLKQLVEIKALVQEVIPLISVQCMFSEVAEQAAALLCALAERVKSESAQLKAPETWKVPVIGGIGKAPAIKIDQKTIKTIRDKKEKEKSCWDDKEW